MPGLTFSNELISRDEGTHTVRLAYWSCWSLVLDVGCMLHMAPGFRMYRDVQTDKARTLPASCSTTSAIAVPKSRCTRLLQRRWSLKKSF
jgi:hypothetical protein